MQRHGIDSWAQVTQTLENGLTSEETKVLYNKIHFYATSQKTESRPPKALFIFGASASGKTFASNQMARMFGMDTTKSVKIDGQDIRESYKILSNLNEALIEAANANREDYVMGYKNLEKYTQKPKRQLKKDILLQAISDEKDLIIPKTCSKKIDQLHQARLVSGECTDNILDFG